MTRKPKVIDGTIKIIKESIVNIRADAIVNAANNQLAQGGGVCGVIFYAAGSEKLRKACNAIAHCDVGDAVITPAFNHKNSKFIIHAVGPVWKGGENGEAKLLYNAYMSSLKLAKKNGCKSIAFPLISSGIFGYPIHGAWEQALNACVDFLKENLMDDFTIVFAALKDSIVEDGRLALDKILNDRWFVMASEPGKKPFEELDRSMQSFMKETLLLLKAIYKDDELREFALKYKYAVHKDSVHAPVLNLLGDYFEEKNIFDILFWDGSVDRLLGEKSKNLPKDYKQVQAVAESLSKIQILALFSCMMRHVSYCARAYEEYIFYPWLIGEGVLIPLFEAYLKEKTA